MAKSYLGSHIKMCGEGSATKNIPLPLRISNGIALIHSTLLLSLHSEERLWAQKHVEDMHSQKQSSEQTVYVDVGGSRGLFKV